MNLIFDLDGTLTDPKEGIVNSVNYALRKFDLPPREASFLAPFIGPPLQEALGFLLETEDPATLARAVAWYRELYTVEGYMQNYVYDGIPALLLACQNEGHRLFIATSKRKDIAENVLRHFELLPFFTAVYGCDVDISKSEILGLLLREQQLSPARCLMIGDRNLDIAAGCGNGMSTVGVLWGYGSSDELTAAAPDYLLSTPSELLAVIKRVESRDRSLVGHSS